MKTVHWRRTPTASLKCEKSSNRGGCDILFHGKEGFIFGSGGIVAVKTITVRLLFSLERGKNKLYVSTGVRVRPPLSPSIQRGTGAPLLSRQWRAGVAFQQSDWLPLTPSERLLRDAAKERLFEWSHVWW